MNYFIKNLLIVDDDIIDFMCLSRILKGSNLNILYAKDGLEALELIGKKEVQCVISDIDMPKMNGIELINKIRDEENFEIREIPVIVISGNTELNLINKYRDFGIDFFLEKPANPKHLLRIINLIMGVVYYRSAA